MKTLVKLSSFFLILLLIAYFIANYVLKKFTERAIVELKPKLEQKGIIVENFNYSSVRLLSYNSCVINDIDLDFYLNRKMYGKESFKAEYNAKSLNIRFADFNNPSFFFTFKDFSLFIEPEENSQKKPFGKLENGYLKSRIPLYLKTPEESVRNFLAELKILFYKNETPLDLDITVDVLLGIDDKEVKVGLFTVRKDNLTFLKFIDEDIVRAASDFDLDLAEKEAEIISNYPSKVPAMIKITRDAKRHSKNEKVKDNSFPEDAFRHVYWSYSLTREFGPELAKEITDARETAPGNTEKERLMDYHNNEIGRMYANRHISVNDLKKIVLNSDDVINNPDQVK